MPASLGDEWRDKAAHSHGNVLVMEVLKRLLADGQKPIHNYALLQAAVAAECLDTNAAIFPNFIADRQSDLPDNFYAYAGPVQNALSAYNGSPGQMVNFYNTNDYALHLWVINNQEILNVDGGGLVYFKPLAFSGYATDGVNSWLTNNLPGQVRFTTPRAVTNLYEILPFVCRSRSFPLGAQLGVHGSIGGGEVNLQTQYGFTGQYYDHSGEFNRAIQELQGYLFYVQLATALRVGHP